jgi:hypothetical protein
VVDSQDKNDLKAEASETVQKWFEAERRTHLSRLFSLEAWLFWLLAAASVGLVWHSAIRVLDGLPLLELLVGILGIIAATTTLVRIVDAPHALNPKSRAPTSGKDH